MLPIVNKPKTKRNNEILKLRKKGVSYRKIGLIYGITARTVWEIVNGYRKK